MFYNKTKHLKDRVKELTLENKRLWELVKDLTDARVAMTAHPATYAQYAVPKELLKERTEAEKQVFQDLKGMQELGILGA